MLPPADKKAPKARKSKKAARSADAGEAEADGEKVVLLLQHDQGDADDGIAEAFAQEHKRSEPTFSDGTLAVGARVCVQGLQQEPWHNGCEGVVAGYVHTANGSRCNVVCTADDGSEFGLCLRLENLRLATNTDRATEPAGADEGSVVSVALPVCSI